MTIESSRAEIARFRQAAHAGTIKFDPAAARRCAELYDHQVDRLLHLQQRLESVAEPHGFGGFVSAQQLQAGFGHKARDAAALLDHYIEAAYRMKEAFLISGGLYEEADAANAAAVRAVASRLPR
ncbi:hypothetical protein [Nocardia cyriacigeorgica]|uniref:Uncharacterized protein n=1 Tax=Nocardia cyriacigeorgica TaxID=135487 RepID=A0A4V6ID29_9NOCA|nr:hypothetical protein [Nocardia cyriacigeorgica]MBF6097955.1 hypothetical protein [Nocardia cyriacigeorgica]MBF6157989.1 hypothetical protein [Nocardia cyriacigeorgica]MBF6196961.1 hypothetical protein [Nocardia cyriacigeorgica]MBF6515339.1 hypothetical protein [Nocardia cyriacigeorgica]VFB01914.1 Uncharacterised protein [Nocardia cyriacigeorgica]